MLARIRKSMEEKDQGFTLIELLVVMIIIGILAAIAVPVFLSQRAKARETSAKADVSSIGKDIASFYVDGTGGLTVADGTGTDAGKYLVKDSAATPNLVASGKLSPGNKVQSAKITGATAVCVIVKTSESTDNAWQYTHEGISKVSSTATCP